MKSPTSAMMWSIVIWLISYSPYFFIESNFDTLSDGWKTILCFLPPLALGVGGSNFVVYESDFSVGNSSMN